MNYRIIGVLLALGCLIIMPVFTLLTIVPFFLEIYGFPPLIPSILKDLDWKFFILIGGSSPIFAMLISLVWVGFKKIKDPGISMRDELSRIYKKIPEFIKKLISDVE